MSKAGIGPQGGKKLAAKAKPKKLPPFPTPPRIQIFKAYKSTPEPPDPNGLDLKLLKDLQKRLEEAARNGWKDWPY